MKWAGSGIVQQQIPIKNNCLKCENNSFVFNDRLGKSLHRCCMNGMYSVRKATERVGLKLKHSDRCGSTYVSLTSAYRQR